MREFLPHLLGTFSEGIAILAVGVAIYGQLARRLRRQGAGLAELFTGVWFGLLAVATISMPVVLPSGIPLDGRGAVIVLAVNLGNAPAGLIAGLLAILYNIWLGGPAMAASIAATGAALIWAMCARLWIARGGMSIANLLLQGVGAALAMLLGALPLVASAYGSEALVTTIPWALAESPLLASLLGALLLRDRSNLNVRRLLEDQRAQFRSLVDQMPNPFSLSDRDGRLILVNRPYADLFGMNPADIIGMPRFELERPLTAAQGCDPGLAAIADGAARRIETGPVVIGGVERWLVNSLFPVCDATGQIVATGGSITDVSDLGRSRAAAAAHDEMLLRHRSAIVRAVGEDNVFAMPYADAIRYLARAASDALGADRVAVLHADLGGLERVDVWDRRSDTHNVQGASLQFTLHDFPPEFTKKVGFAVPDVLEEPYLAAHQDDLRKKDIRAVLAAPILVGGRLHGAIIFSCVGVPRNWVPKEIVFARAIADLLGNVQLARRHRDAVAALDMADSGIFVQNEEGRVIFANRSVLALTQSKCPHAPGDLAFGVDSCCFPQPDTAIEGDRDQHLIHDGQGRELLIDRSRLPGGGVIVQVRDVTTRNAESRERVRLTEQLERARRLEAVGQLAAGVAHDFNNLLSAVGGFASFLEQDLPVGSDPHRWAGRISHACRRGKDLAARMMRLSRDSQEDFADLDLANLVADTVALLPGILPSGVAVDLMPQAARIAVRGNAAEIEQIVMNLCLNASDAMDGAGIIEIGVVELADSVLDDALLRPSSAGNHVRFVWGERIDGRPYVAIEVRDAGRGIDPAALPRLFEPFYTTKTRQRSTGLGLATVYSVVRAHRGLIEVESRRGIGTTFRIYLPLERRLPEPVRDAGRSDRAPPAARIRVLLVDDEVDITDALQIGLERHGFDVACVNDPVEALAALHEDPRAFDVLLTDLSMPGIDGLQLARLCRQIRADLPVVLWTGLDCQALAAGEGGAAPDLVLQKPCKPREIGEAIRQLFPR